MIKYYIHLFTAVFLASTTWVAVAPSAYAKGGVVLAGTACLITGLVELFGYLAYRQYQRGGDTPYLYISAFVLLGSALFTFWGAGLIKSWMSASSIEQIESQANTLINSVQSDNQAAIARWQEGYEEFRRNQARLVEQLQEERNQELYRKTDSKYFADAYIGGRAAAYRRSKAQSSKRRLKLADEIWAKYGEKIEAAQAKEYGVPKPQQRDISTIINDADESKNQAKARAKVTANIIRSVDIIGLIFSIFILISSGEDDYIPEHPWSEGALHSLHYIKESVGMRLSSQSLAAYKEQELQYAFEQGKRSIEPQLKELLGWQNRAENHIKYLKKELAAKSGYVEKFNSAETQMSELQEALAEAEKRASAKAKMLDIVREKYSQLQQESTRASRRVNKASKRASTEASTEASKGVSNASKKASNNLETPVNTRRVARVSGASKKASKRASKLSGPIEYNGSEYKNLASFRGTMRNVKARAKKTGREDLKEQYEDMQAFLENLQSAVIKKLG